jgi:hypothetical protein
MKKIIIIILLGIFTFPFLSQAQVIDQKKVLYQNKITSFTKMKHTGIGLTIGGVLVSVAGIAILAGSDYDPYDYTSTSGEDEWILGYLTTCVGIGATTGGIVLWSIGGSNVKKYQHKLNSVSLNVNPAPRQMISLTYRF